MTGAEAEGRREPPDMPVHSVFPAGGGERGNTRLLVGDCPWCGAEHTHGGGRRDGPVTLGHRGGHCAGDSVRASQGRRIGYTLVLDGDGR